MTAEALEAKYSSEVLDLVRQLCGVPDLTAESLHEVRPLPEVAQAIKTFLAAKRSEEDVPEWAREVGITADEWATSLVALQAHRAVEREFSDERNALAARYREQLRSLEERKRKELPKFSNEKVERLVRARTASFADLPLRSRAMVTLRLRGKTDDQKSVIINSALLEYRKALFRA
jgi:hypothetical protein